jgi:hypothetical protein
MAFEIIARRGGSPSNILDVNFQGGVPDSVSLAPNGETVVQYDWAKHSNDNDWADVGHSKLMPGWREAAADYLANYLLGTGLAFEAQQQNVPIHFIGHSLGTVVISEAIRRLGYYGINVDQMTTLDPHDQDQDWVPDAIADPQVTVWSNVAFADNYWEDNILFS